MRALAGLIFLAWAAGTSASKILALPLCGAPSHVFIMWKVCKELAERGHEVKVSEGAMHPLSSRIQVPPGFGYCHSQIARSHTYTADYATGRSETVHLTSVIQK